MKKNERMVSFYDLRVESTFRGKEVVPMGVPTSVALNIAREMFGNMPYVKGNATIQISLDDWKHSPQRKEHYLVFSRADASLSDIPLKDLKTKKTRMAGKAITEGIDLTAHVLIREGKEANSTALMLMTSGSSLPFAKVTQALSQLFRRALEVPKFQQHFYREDPSGEKDAKLRLYSKFELDGHPNAALSDILRGGTLQGMDLISDADEMLDEERGLVIASTEYKVVPVREWRGMGVVALKRLFGKTKTKIDKARVRYKAPGQNQVQTHMFNVNELDAAFVRKDIVRFDKALDPRYDKVDMSIMDKLRSLA